VDREHAVRFSDKPGPGLGSVIKGSRVEIVDSEDAVVFETDFYQSVDALLVDVPSARLHFVGARQGPTNAVRPHPGWRKRTVALVMLIIGALVLACVYWSTALLALALMFICPDLNILGRGCATSPASYILPWGGLAIAFGMLVLFKRWLRRQRNAA
jgi:hypothetical protein